VVHAQDRTQGAPRITAELNDGVAPEQRVNHKRVARVMCAHAIVGLRLRRRVRTTIPEPAVQKVPDLLPRDFTATAPNQRYVGDITYLPIADGSNLYLWGARSRPGALTSGDRWLGMIPACRCGCFI